MRTVREMMDFIQASPTAFHAADNIARMLDGAGYARLNEAESWTLCPEGRYYVTRNQSTLVAFRIPKSGFGHFQIVASHSDSPCFKLKPVAGFDAQGFSMLNVEPYGGGNLQTWLDRPLTVAGRLIVDRGGALESRLTCVDRDLALIPNLPIHLNRDVNNGVKLNPQVDLMPICGPAGTDVMALAAEAAGVAADSVVGCDLYLVNRDAPRLWGANDAFLAAPRLDDLECAWLSARALISAAPSDHIDMLCVFDNEETGSRSRQGADSTLLSDVIRRIASALGAGEQALEAAVARSFLVSADNAHAVHPNHPEKYDAQNRPALNGGVVIKFNAEQRYVTDGVSQAVFESVCRRAGVPVQRFANRSDLKGGSTLGSIAAAHVPAMAVDIGLAQLAMHSANETAGTRDVGHMLNAMRAFHEAGIRLERDGHVRLD